MAIARAAVAAQVERFQQSRGTNFVVERGGYQLSDVDSWERMTADPSDQLATEMPERNHDNSAAARLRRDIQDVFKQAEINVTPSVEVPVLYAENGHETTVKFEYGYQNGRLHLMEGPQFHVALHEAAKRSVNYAFELMPQHVFPAKYTSSPSSPATLFPPMNRMNYFARSRWIHSLSTSTIPKQLRPSRARCNHTDHHSPPTAAGQD